MIDALAAIGQTCGNSQPLVLSVGPAGPKSKDDGASTPLALLA